MSSRTSFSLRARSTPLSTTRWRNKSRRSTSSLREPNSAKSKTMRLYTGASRSTLSQTMPLLVMKRKSSRQTDHRENSLLMMMLCMMSWSKRVRSSDRPLLNSSSTLRTQHKQQVQLVTTEACMLQLKNSSIKKGQFTAQMASKRRKIKLHRSSDTSSREHHLALKPSATMQDRSWAHLRSL